MNSKASDKEIREFYSNPNQMRAMADDVLNFIGNSEKPIDGSFAHEIISKNKNDDFDPIISLLEYPQYHLLVAADAIKHIASAIINHENSTSKEPLPLYSFLILSRTAIESVAITQWLLKFEDENEARHKAIRIMNKNFRSLDNYLKIRDKISLESGRAANTDQENFEQLRDKTTEYARVNGFKYEDIPNMLSGQSGQGLLSEVSGTALELLYVQLSSLVHANSWSFSLNSSRKEAIESVSSDTTKVQYAHNQDILNEALAISSLMLGTAFMAYRELFTLKSSNMGSKS